LLQSGQSVIWEEGLWAKIERDSKLADAKKYAVLTEMHFFNLTFDEIWARLERRNQQLPHGTVTINREDLLKCWNSFEKPGVDELSRFDTFFAYDSKSPQPFVVH